MNEKIQSRFSRHEPCTSCGSRDNFARYSSGSGFCFGCGYYCPPSLSATHGALRSVESTPREHDGVRPPPDDLGTLFPTRPLEWLKKYNVPVETLIRHNVKWSPNREQLVYLFYGSGKDVVLWQARNFREGTGHKDRFFTGGTPADVIAAYYPSESGSQTCIIVEDCISGIVCAESGYVGVPCFSAAMPKQKLARLRRYYSNVVIWLDEDKLKEAQKLSTQCALLGFHSKVVHTNKDPKEYSKEEVRNYVC